MQKLCDAKFCQYNTPRNITPYEKLQLPQITCPICLNVVYCSQRCRDLDWRSNHRSVCSISQKNFVPQQRSHSASQSEDSTSTLKSMRRKPEEFEIVNKKADLGKGSYGEVKLVKDKTNEKEYAMKIVKNQMNKKQIFEYCSVENLKREIKIQRKLNHPHVIKLHHYFEDKMNVYLILEYAENGSLFNYIRRRKRLPENEVFVYFFQTCLGIDYLHKNKIIHRDLKPENLLLDNEGNIKICDFGWSAETQNNQRNTFCGTCEYMAPEMIRNLPHDYSLDIWGLGILLYELLHGYSPFKGKNEHEVCENIVKQTKFRISDSISGECHELIKSILRENPKDRLSMREIFEHEWMKRYAKTYGIDIKRYIYQAPTVFPKLLKDEIKKESSIELNKQKSKQQIVQKYQNQSQWELSTNNSEKNSLNRVSKYSQRNEMIEIKKEKLIQEQQRNEHQEVGLMDKLFQAFGCLNRDKPMKR